MADQTKGRLATELRQSRRDLRTARAERDEARAAVLSRDVILTDHMEPEVARLRAEVDRLAEIVARDLEILGPLRTERDEARWDAAEAVRLSGLAPRDLGADMAKRLDGYYRSIQASTDDTKCHPQDSASSSFPPKPR